MYRIIERVTGQILATQDEPRYVRLAANGCWVECSRDDAEGIAADNVIYSLPDREPVTVKTFELDSDDEGRFIPAEHVAPIVDLMPIDGGQISDSMSTAISGHTDDIADLNAGVMELSDVQARTVDDIEAALMEQADASAGTSDDLSAALMELSDITAQLMERVDALEGKKGE